MANGGRCFHRFHVNVRDMGTDLHPSPIFF